ncbi:response regulator [Flavobacterium magnum]|nr:response regulator [Flavobacterium magnum]
MTTAFKQVMIIDDNAVDLYIASRTITSNRFASHVIECRGAAEALEYLAYHSHDADKLPQVIFVDIYMPQLSGFDFIEGYAQLPERLRTGRTLYMLSSSIDDLDIHRSQADEHVGVFLVKPITRAVLERIADGSV